MEHWKDIDGFEGYYQISDLGNVRSVDRVIHGKRCDAALRGRILRQTTTNDGYKRVQLTKGSKPYTFMVHRLVAQAFIDNPNNLPQVNHIDGDKTNNAKENLEWCTHSHNIAHAYRTGLINQANRTCNRKEVMRSDGKVFKSLTEAANASGACLSNVSQCCHGSLKHTAGYSFKFVEKEC